jgi:hypothetical protein
MMLEAFMGDVGDREGTAKTKQRAMLTLAFTG